MPNIPAPRTVSQFKKAVAERIAVRWCVYGIERETVEKITYPTGMKGIFGEGVVAGQRFMRQSAALRRWQQPVVQEEVAL